VPTICLLEMYYLAAKDKVPGDTPQRLRSLLQQPVSAFEAHPLDVGVVVAVIHAPWKLGDPADRIVVGSARGLDVQLVIRNNRIMDSRYVQTV
jgi:PIN domain nuclease of toxin-antitoxin system